MGNIIYRVTLLMPIDGETDFYFGSITSIFDRFTPEQLGVKKESLWTNHDFDARPYQNKLCTIRKAAVVRKKK